MSNQSTVTEFLLQGFSDVRELQILHFVVFLVIYLAAVMGNLLIITAVAIDHHLHSPMYFFLGNLSFLNVCYISVTVPKCMVNSLTNTRLISFSGCVAQVYFGIFFAFSELVLLAAMVYDRYVVVPCEAKTPTVAICHPLRYRVIMTRGACAQMAAVSWISSCIYSLLHTTNTFLLPFCGSNVVDQFFCNIPQLLKISCADTSANEIVDILCSAVVGLFFLISILVSYIHILSVVLRIPSAQGRYKAFSTCLPHLVVFPLFISTGIYTYLRPGSESSPYQGMLATMLYSVVTPVINPLIYSLRNKEIKEALGKISSQIFFTKSIFTS
ncbi:olfactory receptor 14A16-like [Mauremys mutica]|uniref:olfactory receptor 14A16-like n=1 Tax=Mauremys mutica TaxID=74926 RepID=UPI001D164459|nr:olfactory receptor 14A16-like [Mauremys mutica]